MKKLALLLALVLAFSATSALAEISPLGLHELPLTEEPITYTWWVNTQAQDLNENGIYGELEEITGVHIDWTLVSTDAETKRNLMWASGDLPDIIGQGLFTESDLTTYYQYGVLLPIDEYIDTCMPNLKWVCSKEGFETVLNSLKQADGKIYSLPKIESDNHTQVTSQVSINKTWLDALGLDMPTTTDELYDVLVAFKEKDPNGNGEQDEIPFTYLYGQNWMNGQLNGWFGVTTDFRIDLDGHVTYSPSEDGYKEMVKFIRRLYTDGLMD
ncbi:MAG: extracellular solute-binding protein, partial [Clostridia bacterium]|nr:extracellular solute-binding protein [Clostridia bacterium]